jgi:hypothetical protein
MNLIAWLDHSPIRIQILHMESDNKDYILNGYNEYIEYFF